MLLERRTPWPRRIDDPARHPPALGDASAAITFIGHATFLIQTQAGNLLTDPNYSWRAGPLNLFGPRRVRRPAIDIDTCRRFRRCCSATITTITAICGRCGCSPHGSIRSSLRRWGTANLVRSAGIRRVEELDWWQEATGALLPITLTPAHHFSARTPFDRNRALWGGFILVAHRTRIFFAGDTAYAGFFHDIRRRLGPIDVALLPIGAYEPRWFMQSVHMNPSEAVQAHLDLESRERRHALWHVPDDEWKESKNQSAPCPNVSHQEFSRGHDSVPLRFRRIDSPSVNRASVGNGSSKPMLARHLTLTHDASWKNAVGTWCFIWLG